VILRVNPDGSQVRLRDVARVELAGESFEVESFLNGKPSGGMGIRLATGANALETADAIRARIAELAAFFPPGLEASTRSTPPPSCASRSRRSSRPSPRRSPSCSW
jgi:multidrug efflux pump subunit AcrB